MLPVLPPGEEVLLVERVAGVLGRGCWDSCRGREGLGALGRSLNFRGNSLLYNYSDVISRC